MEPTPALKAEVRASARRPLLLLASWVVPPLLWTLPTLFLTISADAATDRVGMLEFAASGQDTYSGILIVFAVPACVLGLVVFALVRSRRTMRRGRLLAVATLLAALSGPAEVSYAALSDINDMGNTADRIGRLCTGERAPTDFEEERYNMERLCESPYLGSHELLGFEWPSTYWLPF